MTAKCSECGVSLIEEGHGAQRSPCPQCGSSARTFEVHIAETVQVYESMRAQGKRPSLPSAKKLRWDAFSGREYSVRLKKMVGKERSIDKDRDLYFERVTDLETGEAIHECMEPLSEHFGHGSAKKAPPK
jgi:uncharacterized Zn finger protein (UPF0148 family)